MSKSGWRMAAPCPTTTFRRHSPVRADLLEVPVRKRGMKRYQQAIIDDYCIIVLRYIMIMIVIV